MDATATTGQAGAVFPVAFVALEAAITAVRIPSELAEGKTGPAEKDTTFFCSSSDLANCR